MGKKRGLVIALGVFLLFFSVSSYLAFNVFEVNFFPVSIVGYAVNGLVDLYVNSSTRFVQIESPENITYNFSKGEPYLIPLNLSASFRVEEWKYDHYDLKHDGVSQTDIPLGVPNPNGSITGYRWGNRLVVYAKEVDGLWYSDEVYFYVEVPNSNPIIEPFDTNIYVCEGDRLDFYFNSSDVDEQEGSPSFTPNEGVFLIEYQRMYGYNISSHRLFSGILSKDDAGGINAGSRTFSKTISVKDNYNATSGSDSRDVNITVIEINNRPSMTNIGSQTIWTVGDDSVFDYQVEMDDVENGDSDSGKYDFRIDFNGNEPLFGINSTGHMYYVPSEFDVGDSYLITVCAEDDPISSPHQNISLCDPENYTSYEVCDNFTLWIVDTNRAPVFVNYPSVTQVGGDKDFLFWAEVRDPDETIPDVLWYIDGKYSEIDEGVTNSSFLVHFSCGVWGQHSVTAVVTDGALNNSHTWNFTVIPAACPPQSEDSGGGGGGGGGGSTSFCDEAWSCTPWTVCRNSKIAFESKVLSPEEYFSYVGLCEQSNYSDERFCGFQIRSCRDVNYCNNTEYRVAKLAEVGACYFTKNPSCDDGITNCHDGECEVLVDCGGPCSACPTCSDGVQNGGEYGVDCGGPCPYLCQEEEPLDGNWLLMLILALVIFVVFLFILMKIRKIYIHKKELRKRGEKREWRNR